MQKNLLTISSLQTVICRKFLKLNKKTLLESEGHEVIQKGRKFFVKDYKKVLYTL
ncbi:MAG TPA: hypothetical protein PLM73_10185 [Petrotogaceae bacterium]|nr:hypothetical protein [Petrotogaceae bacterium]